MLYSMCDTIHTYISFSNLKSYLIPRSTHTIIIAGEILHRRSRTEILAVTPPLSRTRPRRRRLGLRVPFTVLQISIKRQTDLTGDLDSATEHLAGTTNSSNQAP